MVEEQIEGRGIRDPAVLAAMSAVPRHEFVPLPFRNAACDDRSLPIGQGQTIPQPYVVAYMTELIEPAPGMKVLEVGTGSGARSPTGLPPVGSAWRVAWWRWSPSSARWWRRMPARF